jgi:perosamine synthetase
MIRLMIPSIEEDDIQSVQEVLASGFLVQGAKVAEFEEAVTERVGTKYAIAVSSCTAALHLALLSLDVGPGDLVLVTAYSFVATANVIQLCGAQPIFVDIDPGTFNLDANRLEDVLERLMASPSTAARVKAILPVHTFGQMADMPSILQVAERFQLPVIEDAACALGAKLYNRNAGTWGVMGCFSFHPRKAITTGEGGIITTNRPELAHRLRTLRNHGLDPDAENPDFILPGFNYRMTEFQAALGITQLKKLEQILASRRSLAVHYNQLLNDTPVISPQTAQGSEPVYQSYVVQLPKGLGIQRRNLISRLKEKGIETTIGTWHIPLTTFYRSRYGYQIGDFPVTDRVYECSLTLPMYMRMLEEEQEMVVHALVEGILEQNDHFSFI